MPSIQEILILVVAILVLWIVLKMAKLAIKVVFYLVVIAVIAGALWLFLPR